MSEHDRLEELEARLQALARELERARAELRALRPAPSDTKDSGGPESRRPPIPLAAVLSTAPPPSTGPSVNAPAPDQRTVPRAPTPSQSWFSVEEWIGRNGTVVLGAITGVMAAGAFLGWAIAQGLIGPRIRVIIGAMVALAVAALGWRLRRTGAQRFGNILLGLALALMHVDAWGAGPYLHVVPTTVALAMAALASAALATFALRVDEEALFAVGAGGALLAPFVTSDGPGRIPLLLIYGMAVIVSGHVAVRARRWHASRALLLLGVAIYASVGASWVVRSTTLWERTLPVAFVLAASWSAILTSRGVERERLLPFYLFLAPVVQLGTTLTSTISTALAFIGTATAYVGARDRRENGPERFAAELLPLAFLAAAISATPDALATRGAALAALWTMIAVGATWLAPSERRETNLIVAGIASASAIVLRFNEQEILCITLLAAHAVALVSAARALRVPLGVLPATLSLLIASTWTAVVLAERPAYEFVPFATWPSLAAATVVAAWWWLERFVSTMNTRVRDNVRWIPVAAGVLWVREELRVAFSADLGTFLLVVFYAALGVALIFLGRRRASAPLRRTGLAFAIYGALKALVQASGLDLIGLRVGSYALVSFFLFAVAYWYRAGAEQESVAA